MKLTQREFEPFLMLIDTLMCLLGVGLAFLLRASDVSFTDRIPVEASYALLSAVICVFVILSYKALGLYKVDSLSSKKPLLPSIFLSTTLALAALFTLAFFLRTQQEAYSRLFLILSVFTVSVMVFAGRMLVCKWQRKYSLFKRRRTLIVGWSPVTEKLVEAMLHSRFPMMELTGILALQQWQASDDYHDYYLGNFDEYQKTLILKPLDEVLILTSQVSPQLSMEFCRKADQRLIRFGLIPDPFEVMLGRLELSNSSGIPILTLSNLPLDQLMNRLMKRALDTVGAIVGLFLSVIPGVIIAILVKMDSKGSIIFGQKRVGRGGHEFKMYKFRSMKNDASFNDEQAGLGLENDPRITRLGETLRRWNLDELPQFWNVLKGEMSLVGPRPERTYFVDLFKEKVPHYMPRHIYKPGMTGLAQIRGLRGNTSLEKRIESDLEYFENWSIWLDIRILLMTLFFIQSSQK